jgi:protein phosphatase-4 regulatory subunit 3
MSRSAVGRERAASVVLRTGVIEKLCQLQKDAEDLESLEDLHALCRVMQQIRKPATFFSVFDLFLSSN